jgi:hypothetical protein
VLWKPEVVNIPVPIMLAITTAAAVRHPIVRQRQRFDARIMASDGQIAEKTYSWSAVSESRGFENTMQ